LTTSQSCDCEGANETNRKRTQRIFVCGQTTAEVHKRVRALTQEANNKDPPDVRVSATPFNVKNNPQLEPAKNYNIPCFGQIPSAALSVLNTEMERDAQLLSMKVPTFTVDRFVQGKMKKVHKMVETCKKELTDNTAAFDKIDQFATDFSQLDPASIHSPEDWSSFIKKHIADPDWQDKLHFDHILGLFGFTEDVALRIRQMRVTETDKDGQEEISTCEQFGVRWLAKALTGFKPDGCFTDVVNLIYAMMGKPPQGAPTEKEVVEYIHSFKEHLSRLRLSEMWIPNILMHDAESDDMCVWILLRHVHEVLGSQLEVHAQLPPDERLDEKAQHWSPHAKVFRDPDSKNLEALLGYHTKS